MAVTFKKAFDSLALQNIKYTHGLSFEEWERLGVVYILLDVFVMPLRKFPARHALHQTSIFMRYGKSS